VFVTSSSIIAITSVIILGTDTVIMSKEKDEQQQESQHRQENASPSSQKLDVQSSTVEQYLSGTSPALAQQNEESDISNTQDYMNDSNDVSDTNNTLDLKNDSNDANDSNPSASTFTDTTSSSTTNTKVSSAQYHLVACVTEKHSHQIYSLAWSNDYWETPEYRNQTHSPLSQNTNGSKQISSSTTNTTAIPRTGCRIRYLATCAGRLTHLYRVHIEVDTGHCIDIHLQQVYDIDDVDAGHLVYCCTFAGRNFVTSEEDEIVDTESVLTPKAVAAASLPSPSSSHSRKYTAKPYKRPRKFSTKMRKVVKESASEATNSAVPIAVKTTKVRKESAPHATKDTISTVTMVRKTLLQSSSRSDSCNSNNTGPEFLVVAGNRGIIRVIDTLRHVVVWNLKGHGGPILDIQVSPTDPWLLATASQDEGIRLWNLRTGSHIVTLSGHEGHRDAVVSLAWHASGERLASSGMDSRILVWDVGPHTVVGKHIAACHQAVTHEAITGIRMDYGVVRHHFPILSTLQAHSMGVDCVQFIGGRNQPDLLLSKSMDDRIVLWKPTYYHWSETPENGGSSNKKTSNSNGKQHSTDNDSHTPNLDSERGRLEALRIWSYDAASLWYIRFATTPHAQSCHHPLWNTQLAVGNIRGELYVWNYIFSSPEEQLEPVILSLPQKQVSTIRCPAFSPEGTVLVASTDDGRIYVWNIVDTTPRTESLATNVDDQPDSSQHNTMSNGTE
jgi:WD40 repeat protein